MTEELDRITAVPRGSGGLDLWAGLDLERAAAGIDIWARPRDQWAGFVRGQVERTWGGAINGSVLGGLRMRW